MPIDDDADDVLSADSLAEIEKRAAAAIRKQILPIFKELGFQRLTKSVCERWDGGTPELPDRYMRLHLPQRGGWFARRCGYAVSAEVSVFHPHLEEPGCGTRYDSQGRYSPRLAEVCRPRYDLAVLPPTKGTEWETQLNEVEQTFATMADRMRSLLMPAIRSFDNFEREFAHFRATALLSPQSVREDAIRRLAALRADEDFARKKLLPPLLWNTRERPACFDSPDLRRPTDVAAWSNPEVAALLKQSHSLHYMAALADRYGTMECASEFRELARAMDQDAGVPLQPGHGAETLVWRGDD